MAFDKVGFIGLGLIGGSIAKKLKENNPKVEIIATAGHERTVIEAYKEGLISNSSLLPLSAFNQCDTIFLCAPVQKNIEYLRELKDIINEDCCITDVGSTKAAIHQEVISLGLEDHFLGGHPMTGSEKTGILNADAAILENAYYILTPTSKTKPERIEEFRRFVLSLGSIPMVLDYKAHDYATGSISHLPHMVAFSLVNLISQIDDEKETMRTIAAGGFRDITRIASSSPIMWENICQSNRDSILELMDLYIAQLNQVKDMIASRDKEKMLNYFQAAKDYRDSFNVPKPRRGATIYQLFVDILDKPGAIASVLNLFSLEDINIKNIELIHNREYEEGVLRVEYYDQEDKAKAFHLLQAKQYVVHDPS